MPALPVLRLGHPILRRRASKVTKKTIHTKRFQTFLDNLALTCKKYKGVGIAAPQVGKTVRVIIVFINKRNPRYHDKKPFPLSIVINPRLTVHNKITEEDWEGDLSADLRALVPRYTTCTVEGLDRYGNLVTYPLKDPFQARVFQHEIDHLDGVLFIDRVKQKTSISETAMWKKFHKPKISKTSQPEKSQ